MTTDSYIRGQYLKYTGAGFFIFVLVLSFLCHVTLKLAVSRSRPPVPYEDNLFYLLHFRIFLDSMPAMGPELIPVHR